MDETVLEISLVRTFVIVEDEFGTVDDLVARGVFVLDAVLEGEDWFVPKTLFVPWLSDFEPTSCDQSSVLQENTVRIFEILRDQFRFTL